MPEKRTKPRKNDHKIEKRLSIMSKMEWLEKDSSNAAQSIFILLLFVGIMLGIMAVNQTWFSISMLLIGLITGYAWKGVDYEGKKSENELKKLRSEHNIWEKLGYE